MITLWGRNNSTNVKKVRWVLAELDLPYQQILAGLEYGLNHDPEYLAMNPNGPVPLLKRRCQWAGAVGIQRHYSLSCRAVRAKTVCGWSRLCSARRVKKMDGLGQRYAVPGAPSGINGAGQNAAGPARSGGH